MEILEKVLKNVTFSKVKSRGPLVETFCNIITSDIFVSTGSSLALILAFLPESSPILFEENKKILLGRIRPRWEGVKHTPHWMNSRNEHLFNTNENSAILLQNGTPINSYSEITRLVRSRLKEKLTMTVVT